MNYFINILTYLGDSFIRMLDFAGFAFLLFCESMIESRHIFRRRAEIARQMYNAGVMTLPVLSIVSIFTGMVLALQTGIEMKAYHMEEQVGNLVMASLTREMGPFTAAIILTAAVGSAMATEIGTMTISDEIDALEIMSISPAEFLIMPRIIALAIMVPIATIYTNVLGAVGGAIVAQSHLNVSFDTFYHHALQSLWFKATYVGLLKAMVFGLCISTVSCAHGLRAEHGAMGVGKATRDSVVISLVLILISGYYITELFFRGGF